MVNSDCLVIMGSNMAENHPVGFQWAVEAKLRGGKLVHVDPRFTRTSAMADIHAPLRAGTDIAFLGGLIHHVLASGIHEEDGFFREYVVRYTNAATVLSEDYADTEDLDGVFAGFDEAKGEYDVGPWRYEGMEVEQPAGKPQQPMGEQSHGAHGGTLHKGEPPELDETLQHPRCVFQV